VSITSLSDIPYSPVFAYHEGMRHRNHIVQAFLSLAAGLLIAQVAFGAKDKGYVKASGHPGDAAVFINNKYIGPATRFTVPEKYDAPLGAVEITIRDPRFEDYTENAMVQPGKTIRIHYHLKPVEPAKPPFGTFRLGGGELDSLWSIAGGDVGAIYINNRYYGYVDELNNVGSGLLLNPGTYDLHIDSPVYGDIREKITIEADKTTIYHLPKRQ
jgi:hypothetical protein